MKQIARVLRPGGRLILELHVLTVVHELFHVKYGRDGDLVDDLSRKYVMEFETWWPEQRKLGRYHLERPRVAREVLPSYPATDVL